MKHLESGTLVIYRCDEGIRLGLIHKHGIDPTKPDGIASIMYCVVPCLAAQNMVFIPTEPLTWLENVRARVVIPVGIEEACQMVLNKEIWIYPKGTEMKAILRLKGSEHARIEE